jgi:endonuclease-8
MAEGPLVHYYAARLRKVLKGEDARIEFGVRGLKKFEPELKKMRIRDVEAYGKQFRISLADGRTLLVHLMMWGSWGIYARGKPWERDRKRARLVLRTRRHEAVAFSAPVVRLLSREDLGPGSKWGSLGPDPLRSDFSNREFFKRLSRDPARQIGDALLDQTIISGVGNILRIEILFAAKIHPRRLVGDLTSPDRQRLLRWTKRFMRQWLDEKWLDQDDEKEAWIRIYRQSGKPCPRCGGKVESFRQGGRITFGCTDCQK